MGSEMEIGAAVSGLVTSPCSSERAKNLALSGPSSISQKLHAFCRISLSAQHIEGDGEPYILAVRISWYQFSN